MIGALLFDVDGKVDTFAPTVRLETLRFVLSETVRRGFKLIEGATVDMDMKMALVHHPVHDKYFIICRGTNQKEINNVIQAVDDAPEYPEALA